MHNPTPVLFFLILVSCTIPTETGKPLEAYFCPPDHCSGVLIKHILSASDVACALYNNNNPDLLKALQEKKALIVTDADYHHKFPNLSVITDNSPALMHNKFCILDNKTLITGSYNPAAHDTRANNLLVIPSPLLARWYRQEFDELSSGIFHAGKKTSGATVKYNNATITVHFCPEDHCAQSILTELKKAKHSIYFMTASFTDDSLGNFLATTTVPVKGLFDKSQLNKYSEYYKLTNHSNLTTQLHHKVFIIDQYTVITGSYNPTHNGNTRNDENLLIIDDPSLAALYLQEFSRLH